MGFNKTLMVIGVLLLASLLAEGDAQQKDQKASADVKPVRPQTLGGGWGGGSGGWGGWGGGGGGWGGGGHEGGWGGGGWGGGGGGHGGGGWGGGGGGGGCRYRCGYRCCTPQEIARLTGEKDVKAETIAGTQGYGGGGGGWGGGGGGGGCRYRCGGRCCTPQEIARLTGEKDVKAETVVGTQGYGGGGGGWGGGGGGGGGGCRHWCGYRCCTPQEIARLTEEKDVKAETVVSTQGYGGGGGGWGGGGGGGGGGCRHRCGYRCCTPEEIANNPKLNRSESEAKATETKNEAKMDPNNTVKQGEVKN